MRPTRTIIAPLAAVLAAATLAAPAGARPIDPPAQPSDPAPRTWQNLSSPDAQDAAAGRGTFNAPDVIVLKVPQPAPLPHDGVDWADAAIGAGGTTGLLAISLAAALALRRRHAGARFPVAAG
jgi:hypothetical protein